jgi:CBS domain-containing protein
MQIREIMSEDIACCTPDTSIRDAARMMEEWDCGAIPVVESEKDHHLAGIITDRDIVVRCIATRSDPEITPVEDIMTRELVYCYDDEDAVIASIMAGAIFNKGYQGTMRYMRGFRE